MGMYTEFYVNVDFVKNPPKEVVETIKAICNKDDRSKYLSDKPVRWSILFNSGSCYTPNTEACFFKFDEISGRWSLLGKGDIKNYENEIEDFFEFISPYVKDEFMGYLRYEGSREPQLFYSKHACVDKGD